MAENSADIESGNPYRIRLTLLAPKGRSAALDRILSPLTDWVDPSRQIVDVDEMIPEEELRKQRKRPNSFNGCLVTPAISVMLFVRETGKMCIEDVEKVLKKPPWEFHHKVELQNKSAPRTSLAKQEFFKLADDLPLFAACPVLTENEHLRVNLYVHNFPAMVEFYRTITDTEIETNKPEFCVFELYRQPGLDIQLSLKRSQYIYPVPVESAYISFNVKNIKMVQLATDNEIDHIGDNVYTTRDPDGNLVVLYENDLTHLNDSCCLVGACKSCTNCLLSGINSLNFDTSANFDDIKSLKSTAESHDSGRYSDLEGANNASECKKHKNRNQSEKSEGYASSSSSSLTIRNDIGKMEDKNKSRANSKQGKQKREMPDSKKGKPSTQSGKKITPVYI